MTEVTCPVSGKPMEPVFEETILGKYSVTYYYCRDSGLLKTEKPYWLDEAYHDAITDTDTGLVARNIRNANQLEVILHLLGTAHGRFLDVAGGYGLLTRLMRDKGFDCYTTDKYCKNIFAKIFEPTKEFSADCLFAFEVFEHLEDPMTFLSRAFSLYNSKTIVLSTLTFSNKIPSKDWWYYSFEGGQHITFYQAKTLALLADNLSCNYHMLSPSLHLITDKVITQPTRTLLSSRFFAILSPYVRYRRKQLSKTWDDHLKMREHIKSS